MSYLSTTPHPTPTKKKISLKIWMNWDHEKINKFGVITRPTTYIGCNNITTFFFFWTPPLNDNWTKLGNQSKTFKLAITRISMSLYHMLQVTSYSTSDQFQVFLLLLLPHTFSKISYYKSLNYDYPPSSTYNLLSLFQP